ANIEKANKTLNATIWLDYEGARKQAKKADLQVKKKAKLGKLHGIPLAHKDMYYWKGRLSSCGSRIRKDHVPERSATVLERMAAAGAYSFGGLNMAEFAQNPTGHNRAYGDCLNPSHPPYINGVS